MAAEYIAQRGNLDVVLCERGIRTFEPATRNTLDISAIPVVQATSHLPIIVDPSHAAGRKDLVVPLSKAAIARGRRRRDRRRPPRPRDRALRRSAGAARRRPARARPGRTPTPRGGRTGRRGEPDRPRLSGRRLPLRAAGSLRWPARTARRRHELLHQLRRRARRRSVLHELRSTDHLLGDPGRRGQRVRHRRAPGRHPRAARSSGRRAERAHQRATRGAGLQGQRRRAAHRAHRPAPRGQSLPVVRRRGRRHRRGRPHQSAHHPPRRPSSPATVAPAGRGRGGARDDRRHLAARWRRQPRRRLRHRTRWRVHRERAVRERADHRGGPVLAAGARRQPGGPGCRVHRHRPGTAAARA